MPAGFGALANSVRRSWTTRRSRQVLSARSAYLPSQNRFSAARDGMEPDGSMALTAGPSRSHQPDEGSGSEASTQVSLLSAPAWFEISERPVAAATRVSPPGMAA